MHFDREADDTFGELLAEQQKELLWRSVVLGLLRVKRLRNREASRCLSLRQALPELGDEAARVGMERLPDDAGSTGMAGPFVQRIVPGHGRRNGRGIGVGAAPLHQAL